MTTDADDPGIRLTTPRELLAARFAFSSCYRSCSVVQRAVLYGIFQDVGRSHAGAMTVRPVELKTLCERARLAPEIVTACLDQLEGPLLERLPEEWRLWVANPDGKALSEDEGMVVAAVWQMRAELYPLERLVFARIFSRRPPPDPRTIARELDVENVQLVEQLHADLLARLEDLFADLTGKPLPETHGDRIARASRGLAVRFIRRPTWSREPAPEGWSIVAEREGMRVYESGELHVTVSDLSGKSGAVRTVHLFHPEPLHLDMLLRAGVAFLAPGAPVAFSRCVEIEPIAGCRYVGIGSSVDPGFEPMCTLEPGSLEKWSAAGYFMEALRKAAR